MASSKFEKCLLKVCHIKAGSFHPWKIRRRFILGFYGCSTTGFIFTDKCCYENRSWKFWHLFWCLQLTKRPLSILSPLIVLYNFQLYSCNFHVSTFSKPIPSFKRWLCCIELGPFLYLKPSYINVIWWVDKIGQDFTLGQMWSVWQRSVGQDISQDACIVHIASIQMILCTFCWKRKTHWEYVWVWKNTMWKDTASPSLIVVW